MRRYIIRRLGLAVLTLAGIIVVVFLVTHILPAIEQQMGLNRSLAAQFGSYLANIVHGTLGTSYTTGNTVAHDLLTRLPATSELAVASTIIATIIGVPAGIIAGMRQGSGADWIGRMAAIVG